MCIKRLPTVDILIQAIKDMSEQRVSQDHISSLMKLWPGDEITGLLEAVAEDPNSKWEKPEAFFIKINTVKKIDLKLRLW